MSHPSCGGLWGPPATGTASTCCSHLLHLEQIQTLKYIHTFSKSFSVQTKKKTATSWVSSHSTCFIYVFILKKEYSFVGSIIHKPFDIMRLRWSTCVFCPTITSRWNVQFFLPHAECSQLQKTLAATTDLYGHAVHAHWWFTKGGQGSSFGSKPPPAGQSAEMISVKFQARCLLFRLLTSKC